MLKTLKNRLKCFFCLFCFVFAVAFIHWVWVTRDSIAALLPHYLFWAILQIAWVFQSSPSLIIGYFVRCVLFILLRFGGKSDKYFRSGSIDSRARVIRYPSGQQQFSNYESEPIFKWWHYWIYIDMNYRMSFQCHKLMCLFFFCVFNH